MTDKAEYNSRLHAKIGFRTALVIESITIVGTGRVATVLATALHRNGLSISAVCGRTSDAVHRLARSLGAQPLHRFEDVPEFAGVALVAVSDDALHDVLPRLRGCRIALHTSGATGYLQAVGIAASGVLHPLQTFPNTDAQELRDTSFAYGGDPAARDCALELIEILGAKPLLIASDKWAQYHAAAVFASNYQVTLLDAAFELMQSADIPPSDAAVALRPLVLASIENGLAEGPAAALTGPIRRGDVTTIERHLTALRDAHPATRDLYLAAAWRTLPIADRAGTNTASIQQLLQNQQMSRPDE